MRKITYSERLQQVPGYRLLAEAATTELERMLRKYAAEAEVDWDVVDNDSERPQFRVRLAEQGDEASAEFGPEKLEDSAYQKITLAKLGGKMFRRRFDRLMERLLIPVGSEEQ